MNADSRLNKRLALAIVVGLIVVSAFVILQPDLRPTDYALLFLEVGIGTVITIIVYDRARRNEIELRKIAASTDATLRSQEGLVVGMTRSAEQHLYDIFQQIEEAADKVLLNRVL